MNNQECKVRSEIVNINSNNPIFYPFSVKTNKCRGNCNNINDPYARICVPDVVKNLNVNVFNLMSLTNEARHIEWHETCKCVCRLDRIICNNKKRWNINKWKINVGANVRNLLMKVYAMKDLFRILVIVSVNAINLVILVNI